MNKEDILLTSIAKIKGLGEKIQSSFARDYDVYTYLDLMTFFPYKYIDRTRVFTTRELNADMPYIQLKGIIRGFSLSGKGRKRRLSAIFSDGYGAVELVWFRSIDVIQRMYIPGRRYIIFGKPVFYKGSFSINHPVVEEEEKAMFIGGLMPIYVSTDKHKRGGLSNNIIRNAVSNLFHTLGFDIEDPLPMWVRARYQLMNYMEAVYKLHFPQNYEELAEARHRMKFEELFFIQTSLYSIKINRNKKFVGYKINAVGESFNRMYKEQLPFDLTSAQKRVIKEIYRDCRSGLQMNRLVQGDVGSGKTVVAVFAMLIVVDNGYQACLMAPTEILATQHYESVSEMLSPLGIKTCLLTGSTPQKARKKIYESLQTGEINIIVGTHALIEDNVEIPKLAMAIIDEQHRFGVEQRYRLWNKSQKTAPHILIMSATPIPRTLAMTLYGDLDVSVIDEMPQGRKPVITYHHYDDKMYEVFTFLEKEINKGRQAYVVYPMIEENETQDIKDLETGFALFQEMMPHRRIEMVHGKMKNQQKDEIMNSFKKHQVDVLLSTTVIEVGVNVPNATVMVVESANRFGLSQLHQLRGRVGRGAEQSYCILVSKRNLGEEARRRLSVMVETTDGFEIAEEDMRIRGFGDIDGTRQSGQAMHLRIANLAKDADLVQITREIVMEMFDADENLSAKDNQPVKNRMKILKQRQQDWSVIS